jgi:hypothetical protein
MGGSVEDRREVGPVNNLSSPVSAKGKKSVPGRTCARHGPRIPRVFTNLIWCARRCARKTARNVVAAVQREEWTLQCVEEFMIEVAIPLPLLPTTQKRS